MTKGELLKQLHDAGPEDEVLVSDPKTGTTRALDYVNIDEGVATLVLKEDL